MSPETTATLEAIALITAGAVGKGAASWAIEWKRSKKRKQHADRPGELNAPRSGIVPIYSNPDDQPHIPTRKEWHEKVVGENNARKGEIDNLRKIEIASLVDRAERVEGRVDHLEERADGHDNEFRAAEVAAGALAEKVVTAIARSAEDRVLASADRAEVSAEMRALRESMDRYTAAVMAK